MAYQLSELVADVRKRAKDTTFDSDLIADFIQATQNEVLQRSRFPFMQAIDTDTVSAAATDFQLSEDLDVILSFKLVDTINDAVWQPQYMNYPQFFESFDPEQSQPATPTFYSVFGDTILFSAPLDRAYSIRVKYLKTPSILSLDTDVPDVPERFKELLILGALAKVEQHRDNYDIAAIYKREVEDLTEAMLMRTSVRQLATLPRAKFGVR